MGTRKWPTHHTGVNFFRDTGGSKINLSRCPINFFSPPFQGNKSTLSYFCILSVDMRKYYITLKLQGEKLCILIFPLLHRFDL